MNPGIYQKMPMQEYLSDPANIPSLTAHDAAVLIGRSPKHAWLQHPRLGGKKETRLPTDGKLQGSIGHSLILEGEISDPNEFGYHVLEVEDYKTKAAREERDSLLASGIIPVKRKSWDVAVDTSNKILRANPDLNYSDVPTEMSVLWEQDGIACRSRVDAWLESQRLIEDLKFVENARRSSSPREIISYGYHIQAAAYIDAMEAFYPDLVGKIRFRLRMIETKGTFEQLLVSIEGSMLEYGQRQWTRAKGLWSRCLSTGVWPGYSTVEIKPECPPYAMIEEIEMTLGENDADDMPF